MINYIIIKLKVIAENAQMVV